MTAGVTTPPPLTVPGVWIPSNVVPSANETLTLQRAAARCSVPLESETCFGRPLTGGGPAAEPFASGVYVICARCAVPSES